MSTTRHLLNRQRRLAAATTPRGPAAPATRRPPSAEAPERGDRESAPPSDGRPTGSAPRARLPVLLCALAVLLAGFAGYAAHRSSALRDDPATRNAALADVARTSELKGQVTQAVEALFSYNFAEPAALDRAARTHLSGAAVRQHADLLAAVRKEGPQQKLVLTTTVTKSGVERIDGVRARVLVFADQSNTRTATKGQTSYGAAMLAVEARRTGDGWTVTAIDTLGAGS
ncbi:hypothetical protein ACH41E_20485 [Streptomyces sp. NPDC020412]|uniref:hypothetical protein n=1 Tax=Streptomyces sp. NPDC020412 TaxID=3365073 RepID=UPI0037B99E1C